MSAQGKALTKSCYINASFLFKNGEIVQRELSGRRDMSRVNFRIPKLELYAYRWQVGFSAA